LQRRLFLYAAAPIVEKVAPLRVPFDPVFEPDENGHDFVADAGKGGAKEDQVRRSIRLVRFAFETGQGAPIAARDAHQPGPRWQRTAGQKSIVSVTHSDPPREHAAPAWLSRG